MREDCYIGGYISEGLIDEGCNTNKKCLNISN